MPRVYNFSRRALYAARTRPEESRRRAAGLPGQRPVRHGDVPPLQGVSDGIYQEAQALWREVMGIPDNYKVLFLQGGASTQFAAVPIEPDDEKTIRPTTCCPASSPPRPIKRPPRYGDVKVVGSSKDDNFSHIPRAGRE